MQRWLSVIAAGLLPASLFAAEINQSEILQHIERMQQQIQQQQAAIELLKDQLKANEETVKTEVDSAIERGLAQIKDDSSLSLGKNIDGLKLKGDLRLRYERRMRDRANGDDSDRNRFRTRFRLGMNWKNSTESWDIGAGLATGGGDATSTNDTWGEDGAFETGNINLDYAYAKHSWKDLGLSLTLGQQKNPYETSFILWDGDVRPAGATVQYGCGGAFLTAGAYNVRYSGSDADLGNMVAGQVGYAYEAEDVNAVLALGYYTYNDAVAEKELGPSSDYEWDILDLYTSVGTKVGDAKVSLFAQWCTNLGADATNGSQLAKTPAGYDPEDQDMAWTLGIGAKMGKLSLGYAYGHVEGDSVPSFLTDGDFGTGLDNGSGNVEGHRIKVGYKLTKNCSVGSTLFFVENIESDSSYSYDDASLCQIDLKYKF